MKKKLWPLWRACFMGLANVDIGSYEAYNNGDDRVIESSCGMYRVRTVAAKQRQAVV